MHDNILDGVASVFLGNFAQDGDLGLEVVHNMNNFKKVPVGDYLV